MRKFEQCSVGSCRQNACLASGDDKVCGDHWRDTLAHRAEVDEKDDMLKQAHACKDGDDIRRLFVALIEKVYG